ncbi:unnamed protein product [Orchesella dallaii]|uniref:Uncharacterized protein n=1 Tax=Orchesella dallaii TaxID=48710 RepID=A0ABP1PKK8_9HEXA
MLEPGKTIIPQMKSITTAPKTTTTTTKRPYAGIRSRRKHREIPRNSVNTTSNPDNKNTSAEIGTQNIVGQPQALDRKSLLWRQCKLLAKIISSITSQHLAYKHSQSKAEER